MLQAVLGALEVVLTPALLVFLGRPIPRNNRQPLLAYLDKISQLVVHLVGVHLVRRISSLSARCHELMSSSCEHRWPEAIYIRTDGPTTAGGWHWLWFVWISATTEPPDPRSTGYYWTLWESTGVWAGEYSPNGPATTGWMYVIIQNVPSVYYQPKMQYSATPRPNSPLPGCLAIPEEAACLGTPSSRVLNSQLANRLPSACSETRQLLQQRGAAFLATTLLAKSTQPLPLHNPVFLETPLDSRLLSQRTTHLEAEPTCLVVRPYLPLV